MKKILSVVLALAMVLALGVTAFAADASYEVVGKNATVVKVEEKDYANNPITEVKDSAGILDYSTIIRVVEGEKNMALFNITANSKAKTGDVTKITVTFKDKTTWTALVEIKAAPVTPVEKDGLVDKAAVENLAVVDGVVTVDVGNNVGITASAYNTLKTYNASKIVFVGTNYTWTLYRGDYTKMNISRDIYFGVDVAPVIDAKLENKILKALGNDKAEPLYFELIGTATFNAKADDADKVVDLSAVASKPVLTLNLKTASGAWSEFNNKKNVNLYAYNASKETVKELAKSLEIAPNTRELSLTNLDLANGGIHFLIDASTTVKPSTGTTTTKPNTSTGANNAAAAIVALVVMAGAAVATKKIVK